MPKTDILTAKATLAPADFQTLFTNVPVAGAPLKAQT